MDSNSDLRDPSQLSKSGPIIAFKKTSFRAMRWKQASSLDILSSKLAPRDYYKGKNCKPTRFHTRKGGYVIVDEKLPRFVVPDLIDFKLKPYVSQCARDLTTSTTSTTSAESTENKS
ncbi:large ribosomal subunit protein mL41-like [Phragmites australis]|uniref:large ribosomal subunit protein mL41-like n=1 Tax=Phragmites australis TaxID=29695 RepID=UPI002D76A72C|nr:large ribosomal subunit protein mL41-like [Phragmites australis]